MPLSLLENPSVIFERTRIKVINNEGVLPPQITPVGGRLSNFVEGWKHITNDPYVLSIVAQGYRLRFTSPPLLCQTPWEIRSPQALEEILAMGEQIALMLQKNAVTEVPPDSPGFYSNVFLVPKPSGGWHPVIDLKNLNAHIHAPHFRMFTTSSVLSSVRKGDYTLRNRSAGCLLSRTYLSKQQKVPQVPLRKQGLPVSSTTIRSKHSPSGFHSFGAHSVSIPTPSRDLGDTISRRLVNSPPRPSSFTPTSSSAIKDARPCRIYSKQKEIQTGPDTGYPVSRNSFTSGPRGSFTSRVQSSGDSCMRTPSILPQGTNLFASGPVHGLTELGLRSYPSGSFVPETSSVLFSFISSEKPVYATASIRPSGSCQPTAAVARPMLS